MKANDEMREPLMISTRKIDIQNHFNAVKFKENLKLVIGHCYFDIYSSNILD